MVDDALGLFTEGLPQLGLDREQLGFDGGGRHRRAGGKRDHGHERGVAAAGVVDVDDLVVGDEALAAGHAELLAERAGR